MEGRVHPAVPCSLHDPPKLFAICSHDIPEPRKANNAKLVAAFTLNVITENYMRDAPRYLQPLGNTVLCLHEDVATSRSGYARLLCDIAALRAAETAAANGDGEAAVLLQDLPWRQQTPVRLLFLVADDEHARGVPMVWTQWMLVAFHTRLGDEKCPEDLHGHGRDLGRNKRNKRVTLAALYHSAINSGVIEARKHPTVSMRPEDIAARSWRTFHQAERLENPFPRQPAVTPAFLKDLLDPAIYHENPMMATQAKSMVAWQWLCHRERNAGQGWAATASWWSRLAERHHVLTLVALHVRLGGATKPWPLRAPQQTRALCVGSARPRHHVARAMLRQHVARAIVAATPCGGT